MAVSLEITWHMAVFFWDILETTYHGRVKVKIVKLHSLTREFKSLHMKEFEAIDKFMTQVTNLLKQISSWLKWLIS